jgi:hypothetical protein
VSYYVLFFLHARNATDESWGYLDQRHYALHARDAKFCALFRATLAAGGIQPIQLPSTCGLLLMRLRLISSSSQEGLIAAGVSVYRYGCSSERSLVLQPRLAVCILIMQYESLTPMRIRLSAIGSN